jgi:hypothetical protein
MIANPFASWETSGSAIMTFWLQRFPPTKYSQLAQWYGPSDANPASFVLFGQIGPTRSIKTFKPLMISGQFLLTFGLLSRFPNVRVRWLVDVFRNVLAF